MAKKNKLEGRIRYEENWRDEGEYYIFEIKWSNEGEDAWGLDTAFKLLDYRDEPAAVISYRALTKIREWQNLGIDFYWC